MGIAQAVWHISSTPLHKPNGGRAGMGLGRIDYRGFNKMGPLINSTCLPITKILLKVCSRYVQDLTRICPRYAQHMPQTCPGYTKKEDMSRLFPKCA